MGQLGSMVLLFVLLLLGSEAMAQVRLKVHLERDSILIGEQIQLKYTVFRSEADEVEWPEFEESIKAADGNEIEIIEKSQLRVIKEDGNQFKEERSYTITVFDSGFYVIPPAEFAHKKKEDTAWQKTESEAQLLSVYLVDVKPDADPKSIKDPMDLPFKISEIKNELFLATIVLLLLIAAYVWWRNRPEKEVKIPEPEPDPEIPPYQLAMQKLKLLEDKKLWQNGAIKEFYYELSLILREYMEYRYDFPALESTTDEIADRLYRKDIDRQLKIKVKEFLVLSDLVKFAKSTPKEDEHKQSFKVVLEFLRTTKPEESKEEKNA